MHSCISDVADFRTACRLPIAREPELRPLPSRLRLLSDLIKEEALETRDALYFAGGSGDDEAQREALAEVADGLADLIYVAVGAALELGIPLAAVWAEVHRSNLTKAGAPKDAMGKQTKPEGWTPPDVLGAVFGKGAKVTMMTTMIGPDPDRAKHIAALIAEHNLCGATCPSAEMRRCLQDDDTRCLLAVGHEGDHAQPPAFWRGER